jgi:hypothetical protein
MPHTGRPRGRKPAVRRLRAFHQNPHRRVLHWNRIPSLFGTRLLRGVPVRFQNVTKTPLARSDRTPVRCSRVTLSRPSLGKNLSPITGGPKAAALSQPRTSSARRSLRRSAASGEGRSASLSHTHVRAGLGCRSSPVFRMRSEGNTTGSLCRITTRYRARFRLSP